MSENKKYIVATIKLPLEILEDGEVKYYNEKASVSFEEIDKLPENSSIDSQFLLEKIFNLHSEPEPINAEQPETIVTEEEQEPIITEEEPIITEEKEESIDIQEEEEKPIILVRPEDIKLKTKPSHNTSFKNKKINSTRYTVKNYDDN